MNKIKIIMVLVVILFIASYFVYDFIYQREGYLATKEHQEETSKYSGSEGNAIGDYVDDLTNITDVINEIEGAFDSGGYLNQGMNGFN